MEPSSEAFRPAILKQHHEDEDKQLQYRPPASSTVACDTETDPETATKHLARFEFSSDGGGTKVLMVEWQPGVAGAAATPRTITDAAGGPNSDGWDIAWPGKSTNLAANDSDQNGSRRRVFFLLPPDAAVPATVTISPSNGHGRDESGTSTGRIEVKPLPAIFPTGFDSEAGPRGVLHTLWAKRRVAELEREIDSEMKTNAESVGLEMALAEKQWIVDHFLAKPLHKQAPGWSGSESDAQPMTPLSPKSPSGKLGEKLRGLRLATAPADLVPSPTANTFTHTSAVTTDGSDIAVSSLSAISQSNRASEMASLDAALQGQAVKSDAARIQSARDEEDDLFALPLSPRSPDMKKSPFSMLK